MYPVKNNILYVYNDYLKSINKTIREYLFSYGLNFLKQ